MKIRYIFICVLLILCVFPLAGCGSHAAEGRYIGAMLAAEDDSAVYFITPTGKRDGKLCLYDKATGAVTVTLSDAFRLLEADGTLYFYEFMDESIRTVDAETYRSNPLQWHRSLEINEVGVCPTEFAVYGERLAFPGNANFGEMSSVKLDFTEPEDFCDKHRFLCGYEDGEYYWIYVDPVNADPVNAAPVNADTIDADTELKHADSLDFILMRGDKRLYKLKTSTGGSYCYNNFCAVYDRYIYYANDGNVYRRKLSVLSSPTVIYDKYEESEIFNLPPLPSFTIVNGKLSFHQQFSLITRSNLLAVTADGVYVTDNSGVITRISHDGSEVRECEVRYDSALTFFVSGSDGVFKYVGSGGEYGIVS